jgi:DNA-binding response OmpR family regulator/DNA-binding CsgD family transcriptional regulator
MKSPSVLVVDDTPASLGVVCDALRREGVRVLLADSGAAARAILTRETPALVLLDVVMPGEDGFVVCAALKKEPQWREIPIVFLTAIDAPEQKVRAFAAGAVDYVTKPVHVPELVARVKVQLDLKAARQSLEEKNAELESEVALRLDAEAQLSTSLDRAVLVLAQDGALLFGTRLAYDLMAKFSVSPAQLRHETRIALKDGALTVRQFTEPGRDDLVMLALEEEHAPPGPAALCALGLTARQAEVTYWVAQGKSNPEIGIILETSPRTIDKHMERILARLGLENRGALMLMAGDCLRPAR